MRIATNWLRRAVPLAIGAVLIIAIQGIIGNGADTIFRLLVPRIIQSATQDALPWLITLGSLIIGLGGVAYYRLHGKALNLALDRANKMIELDGSMLRVLASRIPSSNQLSHVDQEKLILKEVLRDATVAFEGHVHRAAIITPEPTGQFLRCWAHYNMPQESVEDMEFYIGFDNQRGAQACGVAGDAFLSGKLRVAHLTQVHDQWVCDHPKYKESRVRRPYPSYRSLVAVPITGIDPIVRNATTCLGVLCFDSQNEEIFDSKEIQEVLITLAERLAAAMLITRQFP
jgi:GAF domain-containing protein